MPISVTVIIAAAFIIMCVLLIFAKSENYDELSKMALDDEGNSYNNIKNEE